MAAYVPFQLKDQADRSSPRYYSIDNVVWFNGEFPELINIVTRGLISLNTINDNVSSMGFRY